MIYLKSSKETLSILVYFIKNLLKLWFLLLLIKLIIFSFSFEYPRTSSEETYEFNLKNGKSSHYTHISSNSLNSLFFLNGSIFKKTYSRIIEIVKKLLTQ